MASQQDFWKCRKCGEREDAPETTVASIHRACPKGGKCDLREDEAVTCADAARKADYELLEDQYTLCWRALRDIGENPGTYYHPLSIQARAALEGLAKTSYEDEA